MKLTLTKEDAEQVRHFGPLVAGGREVLCGQAGVFWATMIGEDVTCKTCLRKLNETRKRGQK